jgi:hypothetical protein
MLRVIDLNYSQTLCQTLNLGDNNCPKLYPSLTLLIDVTLKREVALYEDDRPPATIYRNASSRQDMSIGQVNLTDPSKCHPLLLISKVVSIKKI